MAEAIAVIVTDLTLSRLGTRSRAGDMLAGVTTLQRTVRRVARMQTIQRIVIAHPAGQNPLPLIAAVDTDKAIESFADTQDLRDAWTAMHTSARKWALSAWRGGLGGATCYDELLPASTLAAAMRQSRAESALFVGADWCLVDPALCDRVMRLHLENPESHQMTFCQAPPGLCGIAAGRALVEQFAEHHVGFGRILAYTPQRPQADPIGRDVCVQIDPVIRNCGKRFIHDTARSAAMIEHILKTEPDPDGRRACELAAEWKDALLPREYTLELTTHRPADGPLAPQHHVAFSREPIDLDAARRIFQQIGELDDGVVMLGGLGDALSHPQWRELVLAAREEKVFGVGIETDLLVDEEILNDLMALPVDVVSVRLNADTAETYNKLMLPDGFGRVARNIDYVLKERRNGMPWIVPRLIKTADTLKDMETFFERWMSFIGHAVIEPAVTGCGLMPDMAPLSMAPPKRRPCRQLQRRLTIHADGQVARCDQDWLARAPAGNARTIPLRTIWNDMHSVRDQHDRGEWQGMDLCGNCREWHRP